MLGLTPSSRRPAFADHHDQQTYAAPCGRFVPEPAAAAKKSDWRNPQSSALTKLRHSPFLIRATFCPVSCYPIRSVSSKVKFIALLAQSGGGEAYSDSESAPTATCVYATTPESVDFGAGNRAGTYGVHHD